MPVGAFHGIENRIDERARHGLVKGDYKERLTNGENPAIVRGWKNSSNPFQDYASALIVERWAELIVLSIMLALWRWWMGHKLRDRITALEAQDSSSGISQVITIHGDVNIHDYDRQLRDAIETKTSQNLKETIRRLPQMPLGDGHTYARLPDGTNIVTMADGTMRLALPIVLSVAFHGGLDGSLSGSVTKATPPEGDKPDDG